MAVILDSKTIGGSLPVATDGELLGVVARPDLDLIDIAIREASSLHLVSECLTIAVVAFLAEQKILLTANQNLKVSDEVVWKVAATEIALNLSEDCSERLGLDMLGRINTEARESNTDKISHVGSNALTYVIALSVEISETGEPAIVKLERITPGV